MVLYKSKSNMHFLFQGSPLSYSNNPSAPPSPTGHPGPPSLTSDVIDQNTYFINQAQAAALQQDFEQFTMVRERFIYLSMIKERTDLCVRVREVSRGRTSPRVTFKFLYERIVTVVQYCKA